jgi:hypothetical protein
MPKVNVFCLSYLLRIKVLGSRLRSDELRRGRQGSEVHGFLVTGNFKVSGVRKRQTGTWFLEVLAAGQFQIVLSKLLIVAI